ncbi:ThuA domain-containing protein [Isosphaeraceae bacterium EP7]
MAVRINRGMLAFLAVTCLLVGHPGTASAEGPVRVLILGGDANPGVRETAPILRRILDDSGRFDVKVNETSAGLTSAALEGFDLVVVNGAAPDADKVITGFVESGKGLLVTRGALAGTPIPASSPIDSDGSSTPIRFVEVKITLPDHPIVRGMKAGFLMPDSLPRGLSVRPDAEVIATADGGAKDQPVLAVSRVGKGRVITLALGSDVSALHEPQVIATLARAAEWAATGTVTLPAEFTPPRPTSDAVKGLVITGGHDHEAQFYSLFAGHNDLGWLPVDTAANAFKKDIRGKYDVVIMYDFTRELDDTCRKNLRDYVEAGGGVVVLHHALLNFQKWAWWSEEVVGGRYRLQREGDSPSSGVKDGQELFVTPATDHPVLAGIAPFHIHDEAYNKLFMSPKIKVLLTTENPASETNVAWIGPCSTAKVVAIQLGHGHTAFGHPTYRSLVHNAVLWAAGKAD